MGRLLQHLQDPARSGVYRVERPDEVLDATRAGHPRLTRISLASVLDKNELLARLARGLQFPAWFGGNWDAWFDCLTDLGWHAPAPGYVLVLRRALGMHRTAPETLDTALAIVEDAARVWTDRGITLRAFIDLEGNG